MTREGLAARVAAAVAEVEGVEHVYDARPAVEASVTGLLALSGIVEDSRVALHESPTGVEVTIVVAVSLERPAADTCRAVFDRVDALLESELGTGAPREIRVSVGRIG